MRNGSSLLLFLLFIPSSSPLNVLLFVPTLSYSHVAFNGKVADELISRGHTVTMLLSVVDDSVHYNGSHKAEILRVPVDVPSGLLPRSLWSNPGPYEDSSPLNPRIFGKLIRVTSIFVHACNAMSKNTRLREELREKKFDVGIVEQYDFCGFGMFAALSIPSYIWLSATAVFRTQPESLGINYPLSYVPELFAHVDDRMSLMGKLENILVGTVMGLVSTLYSRAEETKVFKRLGLLPLHESLLDVSQKSYSIIINSMPVFDVPMPVTSQILHVGGMTVDNKEYLLNKEWSEIVDRKGDGFVLITFGSIAKTRDMPPEMARSFYKTFASFPNLTFILKDEEVTKGIERRRENVYTTNWLPQRALMAHGQFCFIITHGGWSSILESIYVERPLILLPLFGDHAKNSQVVRSKGVGLVLNKMSISPSILQDSIQQLLHNPKFTENARKFSRMLKDSPILPHGEMLNFHVTRAAKTKGLQWKWMTPREAFLPSFLVKGGDIVLIVIVLLSILSS